MQRQLVFLHGFMGHASDWDEVRTQLSEYDSRAINIEVADDWHRTLQNLADSIPGGSIVVGYSMGARLALGIALEFPTQCGGLIFVSGNPGLELAVEREERALADEKIASRIENSQDENQLNSFLDDWYQASVFQSLPGEIRRESIQQKLKRDSTDWPTLLRVNSVSQQPNYWPRLAELAMPTLVVAGERDEKYKQIALRFQATAALNHVKTERLADCGHMVHREQPAKIVDLIREFMTQLNRS